MSPLEIHPPGGLQRRCRVWYNTLDNRKEELFPMSNVKKLVFTAVSVALCIVLPMVFHMLPGGGAVFLPMHIPVLLCGMICGWPFGLVCGLLGPAMSSFLTKMPPAAILPAMMIECAVYGAVSGFLMSRVHTGRKIADLYISLIPAMLLGRIVSGIAKALIFTPGMTFKAWVTASFVTSLPGIVIQLILMPTLVLALTRAHLLSGGNAAGGAHE